jgi:hypothetical protein
MPPMPLAYRSCLYPRKFAPCLPLAPTLILPPQDMNRKQDSTALHLILIAFRRKLRHTHAHQGPAISPTNPRAYQYSEDRAGHHERTQARDGQSYHADEPSQAPPTRVPVPLPTAAPS